MTLHSHIDWFPLWEEKNIDNGKGWEKGISMDRDPKDLLGLSEDS